MFDRVFDEVSSMSTAPMRASIGAMPFIDAGMRMHKTLCCSTSHSLRRTYMRLRLRTWSRTFYRAPPSPYSRTVSPPAAKACWAVFCGVKFLLMMTDALVTGVVCDF